MPLTEFLTMLLLFTSVSYGVYVASAELKVLSNSLVKKGSATCAEQIHRVHLDITPERFFIIRACLSFVLFGAGTLLINWVLGLLLAWFAYLAPGIWLRRREERRLKHLTEQLVDGLELMGNALKSGLTLAQAIEMLVAELPPPLSEEFQQVLTDVRLGLDIESSLRKMAERVRLPVVTILSTGISVTQRCGGDLTEIFQNIADTIRARAEIEGKIQAVSSLGRFQGLILSIMPFALLGVLFFIDREHVISLFEYKFGLLALGTVVLLVIFANFWINRLIKINV